MHSTNYVSTFISVADDSAAKSGVLPPERSGKLTVTRMQYEMIKNQPYKYTSDDVVFSTSTAGRVLEGKEDTAEWQKFREDFFSKGQPCLRASGLSKTFGWGVHSNDKGCVAIFAVESPQYRELAADPKIKQLKAMRTSRA
jgi:Family of unknown function (DUF6157)